MALSGDPIAPELPASEEPRFIVDVNVGKLAKWLRILGFDTLFVNPIEDGVLVQIALRDSRIILTKDTHIAERRVVTRGQVRVVLVEGDRVLDQLAFVAEELHLHGPFRMFSRCLDCNVPLRAIDRSSVQNLVPPYVYRTQKRYMTCPLCAKVYWSGTHWQRMRDTVEAVLKS